MHASRSHIFGKQRRIGGRRRTQETVAHGTRRQATGDALRQGTGLRALSRRPGARPTPYHGGTGCRRTSLPPPVAVRVGLGESELGRQVRAAGGVWDWKRKVWHLEKAAIRKLKIDNRVVAENA